MGMSQRELHFFSTKWRAVCSCTINAYGSLMIKMTDPSTGSEELLVTGVSTAELNSSRAIAGMIGDVRSEMMACKTRCESRELRAQGH